jgi:hypothetical protein
MTEIYSLWAFPIGKMVKLNIYHKYYKIITTFCFLREELNEFGGSPPPRKYNSWPYSIFYQMPARAYRRYTNVPSQVIMRSVFFASEYWVSITLALRYPPEVRHVQLPILPTVRA